MMMLVRREVIDIRSVSVRLTRLPRSVLANHNLCVRVCVCANAPLSARRLTRSQSQTQTTTAAALNAALRIARSLSRIVRTFRTRFYSRPLSRSCSHSFTREMTATTTTTGGPSAMAMRASERDTTMMLPLSEREEEETVPRVDETYPGSLRVLVGASMLYCTDCPSSID